MSDRGAYIIVLILQNDVFIVWVSSITIYLSVYNYFIKCPCEYHVGDCDTYISIPIL